MIREDIVESLTEAEVGEWLRRQLLTMPRNRASYYHSLTLNASDGLTGEHIRWSYYPGGTEEFTEAASLPELHTKLSPESQRERKAKRAAELRAEAERLEGSAA